MQNHCDTHVHTVASTHAYSTVHDYWAVAAQRGIQLFAVTDHAPTMPDGPHYWHFGNMKILPRLQNNVALLRGIEANILPDFRGVDIPPNLEPFLDIAIASFHEPVFTPGDSRHNTQAVVAAFRSGAVQIFGHPGNPNFPIDPEEVVRAARDCNVAIEINNSSFTHSRRGSEPNCVHLLELVDRLDWKVVFASDSHSAFQLGQVEQCVAKAGEIGFPWERVLTRDPVTLLTFLSEHDKPVAKELMAWALTLPTQATS